MVATCQECKNTAKTEKYEKPLQFLFPGLPDLIPHNIAYAMIFLTINIGHFSDDRSIHMYIVQSVKDEVTIDASHAVCLQLTLMSGTSSCLQRMAAGE